MLLARGRARGTRVRRSEVCRRRCAMVGVRFSVLSMGWFVCQTNVETSTEKAEPSETPWHTYDGTPTTARSLLRRLSSRALNPARVSNAGGLQQRSRKEHRPSPR